MNDFLARVAGWFRGRHTVFVAVCMAIGVTMSWFHRLDPNLVTLLLGLQGMVLLHSGKEDYFAYKNGGGNGAPGK